MYELPPLLKGSEREQLRDLRDYLVRLSRSLDDVVKVSTEETLRGVGYTASAVIPGSSSGGSSSGLTPAAEQTISSLRSLIIKTANTIRHEVDVLQQQFSETYVAQSEFGEFQETINTTIETTATATRERFESVETINSELARTQEIITGEIRRGYIIEPGTDRKVIGIAISQQLEFTGEIWRESGEDYYELSSGQTFGLYTSSGWQFYINGALVGYFASEDSSLHVSSIEAGSVRLGGWEISPVGGFGIRFVGA